MGAMVGSVFLGFPTLRVGGRDLLDTASAHEGAICNNLFLLACIEFCFLKDIVCDVTCAGEEVFTPLPCILCKQSVDSCYQGCQKKADCVCPAPTPAESSLTLCPPRNPVFEFCCDQTEECFEGFCLAPCPPCSSRQKGSTECVFDCSASSGAVFCCAPGEYCISGNRECQQCVSSLQVACPDKLTCCPPNSECCQVTAGLPSQCCGAPTVCCPGIGCVPPGSPCGSEG